MKFLRHLKDKTTEHIILDSGLLSYREIIETIQSKSDVHNHFLIYTPDSEIIISPQQTYTKP